MTDIKTLKQLLAERYPQLREPCVLNHTIVTTSLYGGAVEGTGTSAARWCGGTVEGTSTRTVTCADVKCPGYVPAVTLDKVMGVLAAGGWEDITFSYLGWEELPWGCTLEHEDDESDPVTGHALHPIRDEGTTPLEALARAWYNGFPQAQRNPL